MCTHVLQDLYEKGCRDRLVPCVYLWRRQVGVKISGYHQIGPVGTLDDFRDNILYG